MHPQVLLPCSDPAAATKDVSASVQYHLEYVANTFSSLAVPFADWHSRRTASMAPGRASPPGPTPPHAPRRTVAHPAGLPCRPSSTVFCIGHSRSSSDERSNHGRASPGRRIATLHSTWHIVARRRFCKWVQGGFDSVSQSATFSQDTFINSREINVKCKNSSPPACMKKKKAKKCNPPLQ